MTIAFNRFLVDAAEFERLHGRARECLAVLRQPAGPEELFFIDEVAFAARPFWPLILKLCDLAGADAFALVVLEPHPVDYFFHHFGKYPAFLISIALGRDDYTRLLNEDPGNSPADAIVNHGERYVIFPVQGDWFIHGERDRWQFAVLRASPVVIGCAKLAFPYEDLTLSDGLERLRNWIEST